MQDIKKDKNRRSKIKFQSLNPKREIHQILGCLIQNPLILKDKKKYKLTTHDFVDTFHKSIFGAINNMVLKGICQVDEINIDNYISAYSEQYEIFKINNGIEYILEAKENSVPSNFDYNFDRLKKFSLLRSFQEKGIDVSEIYDETIVDTREQEKMQEDFDEKSVNDIINHFRKKLVEIREEFEINENSSKRKAGKDSKRIKDSFKDSPMMGISFESKMLTTIARGMRKKSLIIRSSDTGGGKSRTVIGDLANFCANELWDFNTKSWVKNPNGMGNGGLYIGTEMDLEYEVEPIFWAYISGVPTDKILDGFYEGDEEERVDRAIEILKESNIHLVDEPEFNEEILENHIEYYVLNYNIDYVAFDYIMLTSELIQEYVAKRKGMGVREDQVLIGLSTKLKNIIKKYNVGMITSTQVNGDVSDYKKRDYTIIRGGKGIADKADVGMIVMPPVKAELKLVDPIIKSLGMTKIPNMVNTIYKGRASKFKKEIKIWMYVDMGTMRIEDLFCTDKNYEPIVVEKTYINVLEKDGDIIENNVEDEDIDY